MDNSNNQGRTIFITIAVFAILILALISYLAITTRGTIKSQGERLSDLEDELGYVSDIDLSNPPVTQSEFEDAIDRLETTEPSEEESDEETSEAAIRAVEGAAEAARQATKEATDTWLNVFAEAISRSGQVSEMVGRATEQQSQKLPELAIEDEEMVESLGEPTGAVTGLPQEGISKNKETELSSKPKEAKEIIESRLDFLARMYASNKENKDQDEKE